VKQEGMKSFFEAGLGIVLAVALHALLGKISASLLFLFNPFSWVVLYFSLMKHDVFGAVTGTVCGLLQDSLSLSVFGVAGLTKTLLGFSTGFISRKINVAPVTRNFVFLLIVSAIELALWKLLALFLFRERFALGGGLALFQPLTTAFIVTLLFQIARKKRGESS
jgi:rod shape-determining protein MreD